MVKLTDGQREILNAMADGHEMVFSQDGDLAWLHPEHPTGFLNDSLVIDLRSRGLITHAPYDEDEHIRSGPPTIITDAGRQALTAPESAKAGEEGE